MQRKDFITKNSKKIYTIKDGNFIPSLNNYGTIITEDQTIANSFNDFFINVGPELSSKIPHVPIEPLPDSPLDSCSLTP